jgi:hypothetical protein
LSPEVITAIGGLGSSAAAVAVMFICWKMMLVMSERWVSEMKETRQQYERLVTDMGAVLQANAAAMGRLEHAIDANGGKKVT